MAVIAIDGTLASGKGTLSRRLAANYGYAHLDTGKLYRAVARDVINAGIDIDDEAKAAKIAAKLDTDSLTDPELLTDEIASGASRVAVHQDVRKALLGIQREFAAQPEGAVIDGRDIGTVICPNADVKLFVDAAPEARAQRRYAELISLGKTVSLEQVLADLIARDARDKGRKTAPLKPAADAHILDTTELLPDAVFERAVSIIDAALDHG